MTTFQVQLWPEGQQWDGQPYQKVEAATPKEAAEKLYGKPLQDRGADFQRRALVRMLNPPSQSAMIFYER